MRQFKKIMPVGQRIVVKPIPDEDMSKGGIIIPDSGKDKPLIGTVEGIGDGEQDTNFTGKWPPTWLKLKTIVLFGRYAGTELPSPEKEEVRPRVIGVEEVLGVVEL